MFMVGPTFFSGEAAFSPVLTPGSEATIASPASTTWVGAVPLQRNQGHHNVLGRWPAIACYRCGRVRYDDHAGYRGICRGDVV